jgi:hypothetical protein
VENQGLLAGTLMGIPIAKRGDSDEDLNPEMRSMENGYGNSKKMNSRTG